MAKEIKYYQEDKPSKGDGPCEINKYSKWRVEEALETLERARDVLDDPKMLKYVKLCMQHKAQCLAETASKLGMENKVGEKLKEMFTDA